MRSQSFSTERLGILLFLRSKEKRILTVELLDELENRVVVEIIRVFAELAMTSLFIFRILSRCISFVLFESISVTSICAHSPVKKKQGSSASHQSKPILQHLPAVHCFFTEMSLIMDKDSNINTKTS